uniref:Fatty acid desaturase domain-containing protein n=1 Tax=Romanomermis culicivorax TaxID=13658 RepID=A0A915I517_ROMCU
MVCLKSSYMKSMVSYVETALIVAQNPPTKEPDVIPKAHLALIAPPAPLRWTWADVIWYRVVLLLFMHLQLPWSLYVFFFETSLATFLWAFFVLVYAGMGVTIGAHRLWAHRSFKAKPIFHWIAMMCYSTNFMEDAIDWATTHRTHHRYSDTDQDPHDSRRGFFYSHVGWLLIRENEKVKKAKSTVDVSDLYVYSMTVIFMIIIPTCVPLLWGERLWISYHVALILRYTYSLHIAFTVNSLAHMFGMKPYDINLKATESIAAIFLTAGEGWHNYHHVFPQDYRASEYPWLYNLSTVLIDFFALFGLVYDRKIVSGEVIQKRKRRTGSKQ